MTEEKMRKTVMASVVAGTLLLFCLIVMLIYQAVTISVYNKKISNLQDKVVEYERLVDEHNDEAAKYKLDEVLKELARMNGWRKK